MIELLRRAARNGQPFSQLESKDIIEPQILDQVAKALGVPTGAIKNFNEDAAINIVGNTFTDFKNNAIASAMNYQCSFNPLDKVIELYERMLKEKQEIIDKLVNKG